MEDTEALRFESQTAFKKTHQVQIELVGFLLQLQGASIFFNTQHCIESPLPTGRQAVPTEGGAGRGGGSRFHHSAKK